MNLYLITNRKLVADGSFFSVIEQAIAGGINAIILREKDLPGEDLLTMAGQIKKIIAGRSVCFIINNNLEVAKAIQADGYHTSFDDFMQQSSRFDGWNGVSVHNLDEAITAAQNGANYLLVSHIFATDCKKGLKPKGVELIRDIKINVNIPVIALGGINPANCGQVCEAGADGIAVMSFIMQSHDPYKSSELLKRRVNDRNLGLI
ncbi:MAG: thiamine phosphate synthase [Syntrophomonas sp.]|nr:thiamine phosphate synthase [Syntrophomonas sp.]